ncbi:hypothetical protein D9M71_842120 [compost metagenome]
MNVLEMEIDKDPIVTGQIHIAQCAAQVALGLLIENFQVEIDSFPEVFVDARKIGLSSSRAERQDFHRLQRSHSLMALRV